MGAVVLVEDSAHNRGTGFSGKLAPVERNEFRSAAKVSNTNFLLTANFFLHSVQQGLKNIIPVDEFVRQAVMEPHSQAFDRLGLFVFNLSLGANGRAPQTVWSSRRHGLINLSGKNSGRQVG